MQLQAVLIVLAITFGPLILTVYAVISYRKNSNTNRKNPINNDLLRSPGESLRIKIEDINMDISSYLSMISVIPLMIYTLYLSLSALKSFPLLASIVYIFLTIFMIIYFCFKLKKLLDHKAKLSLGYDAELAVGQELNSMMRDGYWVFHDVPAENYNIDHVVVGAAGVFAIETKGRAKPKQKNGKDEYKVIYDGNKLNFPGWSEIKPLEQASRQAKSLQAWLSSAVGEVVNVKPVLVLPGWFVERISKTDIIVLNGKNPNSVLGKIHGKPLDDKLIQRITHQLDQRCRTVKTQALKST
ncbi:MAG: hypothetical protein CTY10_06790 [Methylotenera sp.]|nr:MAG: hypothetical protein CTY10_06790 [Methylotenera sp.]